MSTLLGVQNAHVRYPRTGRPAARLTGGHQPWVNVVRGVSLEIGKGETLAVVGESGSGKTTLAMALMGLVSMHRGEVRIEGEALAQGPRGRLRPDRGLADGLPRGHPPVTTDGVTGPDGHYVLEGYRAGSSVLAASQAARPASASMRRIALCRMSSTTAAPTIGKHPIDNNHVRHICRAHSNGFFAVRSFDHQHLRAGQNSLRDFSDDT